MSNHVTYEEVRRAAVRRIRRAQPISADAIRTDLGDRGSKTTILKHLNSWRETLDEDNLEVLPASVPGELINELESIWNLAQTLAEDNLANYKAELEASNQQAREYAAEAQQRAQASEQRIVELTSKLNAATDDNKRLELQLEDYRESIAGLRAEVAELKETVGARDRQLEQERVEAQQRQEAALTQQRQEYEAELQRINNQVQSEREGWQRRETELLEREASAKAQAEAEYDRTERQVNYWIRQVDEERQRNQSMAESYERRIKKLEADLNIAQRRGDSALQRLDQLLTGGDNDAGDDASAGE